VLLHGQEGPGLHGLPAAARRTCTLRRMFVRLPAIVSGRFPVKAVNIRPGKHSLIIDFFEHGFGDIDGERWIEGSGNGYGIGWARIKF
jgi:hypothetical protein